jgi:ComF family protein
MMPASALCGVCQIRPPRYVQTLCPLEYAGVVEWLVGQMKYSRRLEATELLANLLVAHVAAHVVDVPDVIVPMPLHPARLRWRGFNQAVELARPLAQALSLPLELSAVRRTRKTAEQAGLSATQRKRNVKNAFAVDGNFAGKRIAIVDDVLTTGSTVNELAKSLQGAGCGDIQLWICARASIRRK